MKIVMAARLNRVVGSSKSNTAMLDLAAELAKGNLLNRYSNKLYFVEGLALVSCIWEIDCDIPFRDPPRGRSPRSTWANGTTAHLA
jgi:hypothetical protein